ncbi:MAG: CARDB domain-containing protein [Candidatus Bathyarchaeia archaeon]
MKNGCKSLVSHSAKVKLKTILVIDLLIVALATGVYFYLQNTGQLSAEVEAEFTVSDLIISPAEAEIGENITISANVTNTGKTEGSYTLNLTINDVTVENQTLLLSSGDSKIVEFTYSQQVEGIYTAKIGNLTGTFTIKKPVPTESSIVLSRLLVTPYEVNIGSPVSIKVNAKNPSAVQDSLLVKVTIDGAVVGTKVVELNPGESTDLEFTINATTEGSHRVKVNSLSDSFRAVPPGMHTLSVIISPVPKGGGGKFKINGEEYITPYTALLPEGTYIVEMPSTDPTGQYGFLNWENKDTNPIRRISLTQAMILVAYYEHGTSCPSLFVWNGTDYVYIAEVSNHGWLGYMNYVTDNPDWPIVYWRNNPWDYVPIEKNQIQPKNGYYDLTLIQKWNEIFYLDTAYLVVVDHPANVNVYSTMVEQYLDPEYMGKIYTVSKNPKPPVSAVNEKGENVLPYIIKIDDVFTPGINGIQSPSWNNIKWNRLTIDLGDLSGAKEIKLVVRGIVDWGSADDYNSWIDKFFDPANPAPPGTQITPAPYLEVKDADGNWIRVPEGRQFPIPPDGVARTFVVDLTGLFPTNDYTIRISNFWNVTFDYIAVDTTPQANITTYEIYPQANLYNAFFTASFATGNFTRYGDVTSLLLKADDMYVIGRQGDAVSLKFPIANLGSLADGMERDYFLFVALWFKDETGNWGYGFNFTVDPLPFQNMSGFPYPLDAESYPNDPEHANYLREYNTRIITLENFQPQESHLAEWVIAVVVIIAVADALVLAYYKRRSKKLP